MVAAALGTFLKNDGEAPEGTLVTAVFPGGCQMRCAFCIVRHRGERDTTGLEPPSPRFYAQHLSRYGEAGMLAGGAIVGDEPLQEEVWPYVQAFLDECTRWQRPSALITNGIGLGAFWDRLDRYTDTTIVVSVDAVGPKHDRLRGFPGAFERIQWSLLGIERTKPWQRRLAVATILRSGHLDDALAVLQFVGQLGVKKWLVSPMLDPRPGKSLRIQNSLQQHLPEWLTMLAAEANRIGVQMIASDEFSLIDDVRTVARFAGFSVRRPNRPPSLIRLDAIGRCWTWSQISQGVAEYTPAFQLRVAHA